MRSSPRLVRMSPCHRFSGTTFTSTLFLLSLGTSAQVLANQPPTATSATVTTKEDSKAAITLKGKDVDKNKLTYTIVTTPMHGTVTLKGAKATYTPAVDYFNTIAAPDSFTFKVNDGTQDSAPASISVVVTAVNDSPVAQGRTASATQDTTLDIPLAGTDVDGNPLTYVPAKKSEKGGAVVLKSGNTVTYTPKQGYIGADSFTFRVKDNNKGTSNVATVSIIVSAKPQNFAPTANAGVDQSVNEQTVVTLDGGASQDSDGIIASYAWKQTAGTKVSLSSANVTQPIFTAPDIINDEILTFELTVQDNKGATAKDVVNIIVNNIVNQPPIANAGLDQSVDSGISVTLDGSVSSDPDGEITSYTWKQIAGSSVALVDATTAQPIFIAPIVVTDSTLMFELTVVDNNSATTKDTVNVLVKKAGIIQPSSTGKLNDTGIVKCGNSFANDRYCPQYWYPGQDADYGRDANQTTNNDHDGYSGFSFTKISNTGLALPVTAPQWQCVKDNVTGLIWEVKTDDGGLHDQDWTYSWYEPNNAINGGTSGIQNGGSCGATSQCDTHAYVQAVNIAGWCGAQDWRMPTIEELSSLARFDREFPNVSIDTIYFPDIHPAIGEDEYSTGIKGVFWSSTPGASSYSKSNKEKWAVSFYYGTSSHFFYDRGIKIRLVRDGE